MKVSVSWERLKVSQLYTDAPSGKCVPSEINPGCLTVSECVAGGNIVLHLKILV